MRKRQNYWLLLALYGSLSVLPVAASQAADAREAASAREMAARFAAVMRSTHARAVFEEMQSALPPEAAVSSWSNGAANRPPEAASLVGALEASRAVLASERETQRLLSSSAYRVLVQDVSATLQEPEMAAGVNAVAPESPIEAFPTSSQDGPFDPECVEARNNLIAAVASWALSGFKLYGFIDVLARLYVWQDACRPDDGDVPPSGDDIPPPDDPNDPNDPPWDWPPRPRPPKQDPPAEVDPDNDCKASLSVTAYPDPERATTLRLDYGDGAYETRAVPQGTEPVTFYFSHQYQPPPPPYYLPPKLEVRRASIVETGDFTLSFFLHGQPYIKQSPPSCPSG